MTPPTFLRSAVAIAAGCALAAPLAVFAQSWPSKPLKMIVGYPPGGGADTVGRLLAERLSKTLGQQVVVENRAGAGGTIGATFVARSDPDGYTLYCAASSEITIAPATMKAMPFDPQKDLRPVALAGKWPYLLVASTAFPPNTVAELIAYAKANPGKVSFSSFGNNTVTHLGGEMFKLQAGIDAVHVPYKGSGPSIADLIGGQIQFTFDSPAVTLGQIRGGKLKALAVTATQRLANAPSVPTTAEAGLPGVLFSAWIGILAPAKTAQAVVERLNADINATLGAPDFRATLETRSILPGGGTSEEFGRQIAAEIAEWRQVAPKIGITPE